MQDDNGLPLSWHRWHLQYASRMTMRAWQATQPIEPNAALLRTATRIMLIAPVTFVKTHLRAANGCTHLHVLVFRSLYSGTSTYSSDDGGEI